MFRMTLIDSAKLIAKVFHFRGRISVSANSLKRFDPNFLECGVRMYQVSRGRLCQYTVQFRRTAHDLGGEG
jgi:hypothetical protein